MTRNMIFGSVIGGIIVLMAVGSLFSDKDSQSTERRGYNVKVDIDVDGDEIVITTDNGRTAAHTKDGKVVCGNADTDITITRADGSQTKIEC